MYIRPYNLLNSSLSKACSGKQGTAKRFRYAILGQPMPCAAMSINREKGAAREDDHQGLGNAAANLFFLSSDGSEKAGAIVDAQHEDREGGTPINDTYASIVVPKAYWVASYCSLR
ncbi:hypothetical protein L1987_65224 [Smallanthus sonchifolius]|uniref:Uncharacterized protein n=1 Tax=Smallanthus sonchifolius TaxID=185202 RepID=A0ACB9BTR9_9ASTR|nr:hypothetical protein L1987_65224 [Smallanthus sonchifolius]